VTARCEIGFLYCLEERVPYGDWVAGVHRLS
jgi:hypothetical protein